MIDIRLERCSVEDFQAHQYLYMLVRAGQIRSDGQHSSHKHTKSGPTSTTSRKCPNHPRITPAPLPDTSTRKKCIVKLSDVLRSDQGAIFGDERAKSDFLYFLHFSSADNLWPNNFKLQSSLHQSPPEHSGTCYDF